MTVLPHRPPLDQVPQSTMWTEYTVSHVGRAIVDVGRRPVHARSVDIAGATGSADHGSWGARMAESRPDRTLQGFGSTTRGGSNHWPAMYVPPVTASMPEGKCSLRTQPGRPKAHPTNPDTAGSGTERRSWRRRRFPRHGFGRPRWLAGGTERPLTKKAPASPNSRLRPRPVARGRLQSTVRKGYYFNKRHHGYPVSAGPRRCNQRDLLSQGPSLHSTLQFMAADPTPARSFLLIT